MAGEVGAKVGAGIGVSLATVDVNLEHSWARPLKVVVEVKAIHPARRVR